jgi:uncharacterized SAM-binding protein YcdF (DUF218 family)
LKRLALASLAALTAWFGFVAILILREEPTRGEGQAEVAIVLGAAIRQDGSPSPVFQARLEHGLALLRQKRVQRLLFTGGRGDGMEQSEAASARRWAIRRGVPARDVLVEERSRTTRQNLLEARQVMTRQGIGSALIVSDPLHLPRAMRMAQDLGIAARPSPTPTTRYRSWRSRLPFLARESFFLTTYWLTGD